MQNRSFAHSQRTASYMNFGVDSEVCYFTGDSILLWTPFIQVSLIDFIGEKYNVMKERKVWMQH